VLDWLLRTVSRRGLALGAPLVPWLGDTAAARGLLRGLDPQLATMLALNERLRIPPIDTMTVERARRFAARGLAAFDAVAPPMDVVIDTAVPAVGGPGGDEDGWDDDGAIGAAIPVRIYRPHGAGRALILWFHGGGGVIGSIDSSDVWTRVLAHETRCTVASVDYRLAPEHVHPAAVDDAVAAWAWACASGAREYGIDRIAVGGDSFGGFLAARVAAHAAAAGPRPLALQVLVYPMLDLSRSASAGGDNAEGYLLTADLMRWFTGHYAPERESHRAASPAFFPHLAGQAPAIVVTAGFDPLVVEGRAYAERLAAARVRVTHQHHASLIHGFISMTGAIDAARSAADELFAAIRAELAA
jgi:acetyl esterase